MRGGDAGGPFFCFAASRCFLSFEAALAFNMLASPSATAKLKGLFDLYRTPKFGSCWLSNSEIPVIEHSANSPASVEKSQ
jgi:hypothetical protein